LRHSDQSAREPAFQTVAIGSFLLTQDEAGLFTVAAAFALCIPSYSVAIRDLFSAAEACHRPCSRRCSAWLSAAGLPASSTMISATAPAFGVGVVFNIANLLIVGFLVLRLTGSRRLALWPAIG
jgi:hypothetical protein